MAPNLCRRKRGKGPKKPKSFQELKDKFNQPEIREKYGKTRDRKDDLYIDTIVTTRYSFCVFASPKTIQVVRQNQLPYPRRFLIDGTFKISPKSFYQLLTISIEYENDVSVKTKKAF